MKHISQLQQGKIVDTISLLEKRIGDRFPDSGLRKICNEFLELSKQSKKNISWISKPNIPLRLLSFFLIATGISGVIYSFSIIDLHLENTTFENIITLSEAIFNDIILLGAAIFFLVTIEAKVKRKKALQALNELRVIAHVIDMHQLTKDPLITLTQNHNTEHSPKRSLSNWELQRYLDYCSEAFSLISKVAALYSQSLPDEVIVKSVNEIENLNTGLSRKVWQKIMILNEMEKTK